MIRSSHSDWAEIRSILERAFELEPEARAEFLQRECADSTMRREVESLLAADAEADGEADELVEQPITDVAGNLLQEIAADELPGSDTPTDQVPSGLERIGPYELLKPLGRGGMGSVYLAKRSDFKKLVAIKLIRRGMDTDDIVQRFRNERQILASLDHPNIARLLDGGMTDEGLPYFVMEYVDGLPIDVYCDRHRFSIEERLELFRTVCDAVQFAHQNLVVHRDLKPSNIYVLPSGDVKLLDFGIAKLLNPDLASSDVVVTFQARRFLTPEYASPEQIRGEPVTTATDVYALGVLLYEILTGSRPYRATSRNARDLEQSIIAEAPVRPSTAVGTGEAKDGDRSPNTTSVSEARRTQPDRLRRQLRGDLDNIVMMAMRKEPLRRYTSAKELGEDIRRHLVQLPISAQKDTVRYRLGKFVQRNKAAVAAGVLIVLSLMGGAVVSEWQRQIARDERDLAERETERANAAMQEAQRHALRAARVTDFLVGMVENTHRAQSGGTALTVRDILHQGSEWIDRELADEPQMHASMLLVVARIYHALGLCHDRVPLIRKAVGIRRQLYTEPHVELVRAIRDLAEAEFNVGNGETTQRLFDECMQMVHSLYDGDHPEIAQTLTIYSYWTGSAGYREKTTDLRRRALEMRRRLHGDSHRMVAQGLNDYGVSLNEAGKWQEAEAAHREALAIRRRHDRNSYSTAISLGNLAGSLSEQGHYDEALRLFRESVEVRLARFGPDHQYTAIGQRKLAGLLVHLGHIDEAEKLYLAALGPMSDAMSQGGHFRTDRIRFGLAEVRLAQRRPEEAHEYLREVRESQAGRHLAPFQISWRQILEGACLGQQSRFEEGEKLLQEGYDLLRERKGLEALHVQRAHRYLADFYEAWGKPDKAAAYRPQHPGKE